MTYYHRLKSGKCQRSKPILDFLHIIFCVYIKPIFCICNCLCQDIFIHLSYSSSGDRLRGVGRTPPGPCTSCEGRAAGESLQLHPRLTCAHLRVRALRLVARTSPDVAVRAAVISGWPRCTGKAAAGAHLRVNGRYAVASSPGGKGRRPLAG